MYSKPLLLITERWGLPSVQWATHPSQQMRFTWCAVGPSSLLREEVYPVCSGLFIPLESGGLPSVQWAPHPSWEMMFTQCAVGPSSLLREEVYLYIYIVCSEPIILLRDEAYPVCSWPLIPPDRERRFTWCAVSPSSLLIERGGLPSVQWAPHPSWEIRFTQCVVRPSSLRDEGDQCAISPSSLLRDEVWPLCSQPLIPHKDEV